MKCPNCKQNNPIDANFCKICGTKLPDEDFPFYKRHKKLTIFLIISLLFYIFVYKPISDFFSEVSQQQYDQESIISGSGVDTIALINIDGVIVEADPTSGINALSSEYTSARRIKKILNQIDQDPSVKGILLRVNSPGGSAAASDQIYEEIKLFKERKKIPVVAYFTDTSASGGYYVSMSADKIFANPANVTGSIGVIVSYLSFEDFIQRYGIEDVTYTSGEYKDLLNPFEAPDEAESEIVNNIVDDLYERFVFVVASGRKLNREQVLQLADGRIYSAQQAVENGLIDEVGQLENAFTETKKLANVQEAKLVQFGKVGFFDLLFETTTIKLNLPLMNTARSSLPFNPGLNVMYLYK